MLTGKRTGLRAIEQQDLKQLLEWRNQPEYRRYFREYRELNMESQRRWFESMVMNDEHTRMFSIAELDSGQLIGACGLCCIGWQDRCADFSIYIGKDGLYADEDYAVDAGNLLIDYGFGELNLHRLWAEIYEIDEKKKQMFGKLGFVHEAVHVSAHWTEGRWVDSWYYRLLKDEAGRQNICITGR